MRKGVTSVAALAASLLAGPLLADHHFMKIVEVFPGSEANPLAQYIVLQMYAAGQNAVGGQSITITDANGTLLDTNFFGIDLPNGADQTKILIATADAATLFNVAADLTMQPYLQWGGGRICFNSNEGFGTIDCVAWGGYTGPAAGVGTPFAQSLGLLRGQALKRKLDICGGASNLDACDDTDNSAADWITGATAPRNNAGVSGTPPASTCGNTILEGLEGCDDGNAAGGDGCSAVCLPEPGVEMPTILGVDSAGNQVLEPGEIARIQPSWNLDSNRLMDGALMSFFGPPDSTYNRILLKTNYAPPGPSRSCGELMTNPCYRVEITVPTSRPSLHWDASLVEVTNSQTTKTWELHVGGSFVDVPDSSYYRFVETLLHNGVTSGCGGNLYCSTDSVTREQMAVFLLVSKEGEGYQPPACTTPTFTDVPCSSPFARWVEELVLRQVTAGCGGGNYCPTSPVTREQMAVFLLVTEEGMGYTPPPCTTQTFADVPCASPYSAWIYELVTRGVTAGCGGGNYCPTSPVTREQMAVFLTVNFGLLLYGP